MTLTQLEAEELAVLMAWIEAYSATSQAIKEQTAVEALALWAGFRDWYDSDAVAALAAQAAALSTASQQTAAGATMEYLAGVAAVTGAAPAGGVSTPTQVLQVIRNAAPLLLVHTRPSEVYKRSVATGATEERARELALKRAENLVLTDLTLQEREVELVMLRRLGVDEYRRIIHPELSQTGTCGLCIAAADRVYTTGELRDIHDRCCCTVMPIVGDHDPGAELNGQSIRSLYQQVAAEAQGLDRSSLKEVRYTVREHGEYGPVMVRGSDAFRDASKVALEDDPERAARMLDKVAPVLARMEDADTPAKQLAYQRDLYDRLTSIVGQAA